MSHPETLLLIMALAVLAPLLAHAALRWLIVPVAVFEMLLGVLVGPDVLGWARTDALIEGLSELGLSMLIFLAGYEIDFARVPRSQLRRSVGAWLISLAAGLGLAVLLTGGDWSTAHYMGVALTSTALGTVLPVLRDTGRLGGRFGQAVLTHGAAGEFGPIIAISLLLSGRAAGVSALVLAVFALLTGVAVALATRPTPVWLAELTARTLHTSGHFAVRATLLTLALMLGISAAFGLDVLLGAFAAGVLTRLALRDAAPEHREVAMSKIEGLGFGFLVPVFFITTGIDFDLHALLSGGRPLLLLGGFLALFLLVRGVPTAVLAPPGSTSRQRGALGLYCATALPLVVAIATLGQESGDLETSEAAALVGAAMLSVLLFPLAALRLTPASRDARTP